MYVKWFLTLSLLLFLCSGCETVSSGTEDTESTEVDIRKVVETLQVASFIDQLKLHWEHHKSSYTYEIRYAEGGYDMNVASSLETSSSGLLIKELESDQVYEIQMRIHDGSEWTDWSDPIKTKTALFKTRVSTYNVLSSQYDHQFPGSTWIDRKIAVQDIIMQADLDPDIITVQELMDPHQAEELSGLLSSIYNGYISDKDISARGIFWKSEIYNLIDSDDFDILGNDITGYATTRIATYVHLEHINSGKELMVFNIHLPWGHNANAQKARHRGADNLADIIFDLSADDLDLYTIIPGDYNNYPATVIDGWPSSPLTFSNNGFKDSFTAALNVENGDYRTTNDILEAEARIGEGGNMRVDYIFSYPADRIAVSDYKTIINLSGDSNVEMIQPVPSDHHPIKAIFHLSYKNINSF